MSSVKLNDNAYAHPKRAMIALNLLTVTIMGIAVYCITSWLLIYTGVVTPVIPSNSGDATDDLLHKKELGIYMSLSITCVILWVRYMGQPTGKVKGVICIVLMMIFAIIFYLRMFIL